MPAFGEMSVGSRLSWHPEMIAAGKHIPNAKASGANDFIVLLPENFAKFYRPHCGLTILGASQFPATLWTIGPIAINHVSDF
ncbi:MAG TPA: hypothetical protein VMJ32_17060 [Pirellulales bacterium]|nr:hypothetical protein [Pirellulales bacterium]